MGIEKDNKNKNELKDLIEKSDLEENLKRKLLDYAEELKNGRLEKLLEEIKERLNEN